MRALVLILGAALLQAGCSGASSESDGALKGSAEGVVRAASSTAAEAVIQVSDKPVDTDSGDIESVVYQDTFETVSEAGEMVIKLDVKELERSGFMSAPKRDSLLVVFDPSCEGCPTPEDLTVGIDLDVVEVPVAFYSENGMDLVGAYMCKTLGLEDPSEDCAAKVKGMVSNTGYFMSQGVVELPAVMMPTGWLVESVQGPEQLTALLKESQ